MTYAFEWHFNVEVQAGDEEDACRAAAQIFEKESKQWRRRNGGVWRNQIHRPDLKILKNIQVKV